VQSLNGAANGAFAGGNDLSILLKLAPQGPGGQSWHVVRTRQMSGYPAMSGETIGNISAPSVLRLFANSSQAGVTYYSDPTNGNKLGAYIAAELIAPT
jgi:hypothetical protein